MMKFSEETENVLQERGLKCICQLCNCGRPHHHKGCRRTLPNTMKLSLRDGKNKNTMMTDYQSRFGNLHVTSRRQPIRPVQKTRDPNPPAMDFRTENHESYKEFNEVERLPACKLQGEVEKLVTGDFVGRTVYKDSFTGHQPQQNVSLRPSTVYKSCEKSERLQTDTEYQKSFDNKQKITQESYTERPALAYGLMYPDGETIPKKSLKNSIHDGRIGEKAKTYIPNKDHVQLGTDENANNLQTTSQEHYQKYELSPTKSMRPMYQFQKRGKFTAVTQNKIDFKYDENEARLAKGNKCPEYPSLIKLSMDIPVDFKSVNRMSYHSLPTSAMTKNNKSQKKTEVYVPPVSKFDATTTNQNDYKHFGTVNRVGIAKQPPPRKSSAKIQTDSSYMSQFKNPGKIDRVLYGEQHEDNLRLPPKSEHFTTETVTMSDFHVQNGAEKAKPFKPEYKLHHTGGGELQTNTQYNDAFKGNEFDLCSFPKYLAVEEARKLTVQ